MSEQHPWNEDNYDPSLAFLLWAWGSASGFSNGKGENAGAFDHRRGTLPLLLDRIKSGNPWQPDPMTGRAPVDWMWCLSRSNAADFMKVLEACLTHPQAPDPVTWSTRLVYDARHDNKSGEQINWISAMVSHPLGGDAADLYVRLGGRLDALSTSGWGVLADSSHQEWSKITQFMKAAHSQGASLLGAPEGHSWVSGWKHLSPSELAKSQAEFMRLAELYPLACVSSISPMDEMLSVVRQAAGMRPTSAAWKRLGMDKHLNTHPDDVLHLQAAVLSLAWGLSRLNSSDSQNSTLSYLVGRLSKWSDPQKDPRLLPGCRLAAAFSSQIRRYEDELLLLACGQTCLPDTSLSPSLWLEEQRQLLEERWPATLHQTSPQSSQAARTFTASVLSFLAADDQQLSPSERREYLNELLSAQDRWVQPDDIVVLLLIDSLSSPCQDTTAKLSMMALDMLATDQATATTLSRAVVSLGGDPAAAPASNEELAVQYLLDILPSQASRSHPIAVKIEGLARQLSNRPPSYPSDPRPAAGAYFSQLALSLHASAVQGSTPNSVRSRM